MTDDRGGTPLATPVEAPSGGWRRARVVTLDHPDERSVRLRLDIDDRIDHMPGQHYVVRLTAPDGYTASRSYSLSSAPSDPLVELFVERLDDGEVSPYLADVAQVGAELEVRGPIGGWFVWDASMPALAVGGGTGVVPLVAMMRHAQHLGRSDLLRLVAAARTRHELPYGEELAAAGATVVLSREELGGRAAGRLTSADLGPAPDPGTLVYVCGSAGFAETASSALVALGVPVSDVRVERFGPTGG